MKGSSKGSPLREQGLQEQVCVSPMFVERVSMSTCVIVRANLKFFPCPLPLCTGEPDQQRGTEDRGASERGGHDSDSGLEGEDAGERDLDDDARLAVLTHGLHALRGEGLQGGGAVGASEDQEMGEMQGEERVEGHVDEEGVNKEGSGDLEEDSISEPRGREASPSLEEEFDPNAISE